jgi:hypothetical protein
MLTVYVDEFGLHLSFSVCASLLLQKQIDKGRNGDQKERGIVTVPGLSEFRRKRAILEDRDLCIRCELDEMARKGGTNFHEWSYSIPKLRKIHRWRRFAHSKSREDTRRFQKDSLSSSDVKSPI